VECGEAVRQRAPYLAGADNADLHVKSPGLRENGRSVLHPCMEGPMPTCRLRAGAGWDDPARAQSQD
jgi:hypothetical protein